MAQRGYTDAFSRHSSGSAPPARDTTYPPVPMPVLDNATQLELMSLLSPLFVRESGRRALLDQALGDACPVLRQFAWNGEAEPFVLRLISVLAESGEIEPGRQSLWQLLQFARERVAADLQPRIDALAAILDRPAAAAGRVDSRVAAEAGPLPLRVFLASPGDVSQERGLALQVLEQLPYDPLLRGRVTIETVAWDKSGAGTPMLATMTPQAAIAAGLPKPSACDIVIVIVWSKMGTPLPVDEYHKADGSAYLSGTEWEYLDALAAAQSCGRPEILVYRRTERCLLDPDDDQFEENTLQWRTVGAFFATFRNPDGSIRAGCNEYPAPEAFGRDLDLHLRAVIARLLQRRSAAAARAAETVRAAPAPAMLPSAPAWNGSPFPGLRAFTPDDAPIFFGRARETDELVRRLAVGCRFLAVVGASGSGKSSLVAAGLLPRLRANGVEGAKDWLLPQVLPAGTGHRKQWVGLRFTPGELGDDPFLALAARFAPLLPEEIAPRQLATLLADNPGSIIAQAGAALAALPAWAEMLIFIDQFEELFNVVAESRQAAFIELLAIAAGSPRLRVVVTMRGDFYHRWLAWPRLPEILRAAPAPVAAPGLAALFQMITGPAARAGLELEEGLAARILEDTGSDCGALALLAFALHELYAARTESGCLTHAAYDGFGGVRGAISRRAEKTFSGLPPASQGLLHKVFGDLVDADERGIATRRRVPRWQLASSRETDELIDGFVDARLLVSNQRATEEAVVEVAHEALFREWPRLHDWIVERAGDIRTLRQAEAAADEWQRSGGRASHRWQHERLSPVYEALSRLRMERDELPEPAKSFLRPEADRLLEEIMRPVTTHYRRAEIGDRLAIIGDPRRGIGLRPNGDPDLDWCEIPTGTVRLKNHAGEFPVARFFIARYPLTWRQYQAFVDDPGGYGNQKRWWRGLHHERDPGEQYRQIANCPAENVSWYDAVAYCRWASARLGYEVRLPTEWEWQQAATGGRAGNEYPWGGQWVEACSNTSENRLSRTTAVGAYPVDKSAHGVLDLAGNVGEWCLNEYDRPRNAVTAGDARRVVRGGSWNLARDFARCIVRGHLVPSTRTYDVGLRLVCLPATEAPPPASRTKIEPGLL
ncbi:SUMF1/EgtB/PvdO family nonheme iron enzyme [Accumulibacter sp.]|uniref:nSTAND1 domain-containing NTPase n=1 Tax=Accumulibacter sp. TaxID=2053492 RepID=UPI0025B9B56C|nr:SUMF1/EgtB/PvdO family nonheme iron enzyme [Accumulibacter sp.]